MQPDLIGRRVVAWMERVLAIRVLSITLAVLVGIGAAIGLLWVPSSARADVHLTVGTPEQGGQYATVQAAVDAVPANNTERHIIDIKPGTYTARVIVPSSKPFITLRGEDPLTTKVTFNLAANAQPPNNRNWATTVIEGTDFIAENLSFENTFGTGGAALAMYARGDRMIVDNCRFLGNQDTLRSELGRHYFYNTYVEGTVDFIYGKGQAYFENATLYGKSNGYFTAQGRENAAETSGYVFKNATVTGSAAANTFYLGRPWGEYSRTVFIDSKMGPQVRAAGWSTWTGNYHLTSYYAEYNSMDLNGDPLDISQRVSWSKQLTALEADAFSKANWLAGTDGWNPEIAPPVLPLAGDYNDDGSVDAADYTVWRDAVSNGTSLENETASMGVADEEDYSAWKSNFGATNDEAAEPAAALPEPAGYSLVLVALVAIALRRSRTASSPVEYL
jgi:pectinesterase